MQPIAIDAIRSMARALAGNLFSLLPANGDDRREALTAHLTPGVAAFLGRLMTLAFDQEAALRPSVEQFCADPATAKALARYWGGDYSAEAGLYDILLSAGLQDHPRLRSYFPEALDTLVAVTNAAGQWETADFESVARHDIREFVAAFFTAGLDRVELGQAIAADGETILFSWHPAAMAAPDGAAESVGPEEFLDDLEFAGESGGGGMESMPEEPPSVSPETPPATTGSEPPPSPPPGESIVDLRLDAALPERVTVGRAFELAVAIRRPTSPVTAPDDLGRRESADFTAAWPEGVPHIQFQVQISAPDCDIAGKDTQPVRLYAGKDSPMVYFQLTPRLVGPLGVIITVYQETDWVGSTRLRTEAAATEPRGGMVIAVDSRPVGGDADVNQMTLRRVLDDGYNDSELRDLCFELGIDYEDLDGNNQSAKARELVLYAQRRNLTADLVRLVMRDRPLLLAPAKP